MSVSNGHSLLLKYEYLKRLAMYFSLALAGFAVATPARADVWGYVDERGVAHFAAERVDERYVLFFKGGQGFDTKDGIKPIASAAPAAAPLAPAPAHPDSSISRPSSATGVPPKLLAFFEISTNYKAVRHLLREASAVHNIDYELLQALIATESGFDPAAVSPKGAVGLMQLMPATAQRYGVKDDAKQPLAKKLTDPKTNIGAGSSYLRDLIKMFPGKLELAVAAYNAGEGAVQRYGNKIPPYKETQNYVATVMQLYAYLKPPKLVAKAPEPAAVAPSRIRMELPVGGAAGRGNMVTPIGSPLMPSNSAGELPVSK
jgi:soluble lytic murein transglycosylase-like protein